MYRFMSRGVTFGCHRSWTSCFSSDIERYIFGASGTEPDKRRGLGGIGGGAGVWARRLLGEVVGNLIPMEVCDRDGWDTGV